MRLPGRSGFGLTLLLVLFAGGALASTSLPVDLKTCVEAADVIFAGTVSQMVAGMDGGTIITRVTFSDVVPVRGDPDSGDIVLKVEGGEVNGLRSMVVGAPAFGKGMRCVVLATGDLGSPKNGYAPIVYFNQGLFTLEPDRASGRTVVHTAEGRPIVAFRGGHVVVLAPYRIRGSPEVPIPITAGTDTSRAVPADSTLPDTPVMGVVGRVAFEMVDRSSDPGTRFSEAQFLDLLREIGKSR